MSTNQMLAVWMTSGGSLINGVYSGGTPINGTTLGTALTSDPVQMKFEDNAGLQIKWTGTPTGTFSVQVNQDPLVFDWETITFSPTPDQPSGSSGGDFFDVFATAAQWIRLTYAGSGAGTVYAKIALKSV